MKYTHKVIGKAGQKQLVDSEFCVHNNVYFTVKLAHIHAGTEAGTHAGTMAGSHTLLIVKHNKVFSSCSYMSY